jgi:hypothetical protein
MSQNEFGHWEYKFKFEVIQNKDKKEEENIIHMSVIDK